MSFFLRPDVLDAIIAIFLIGLPPLVHFVVRRWNLKQTQEDAMVTFGKAIAYVGQTYIDPIKKANGVLTDDVKSEARSRALNVALEIGTPAVKQVLAAWSDVELAVNTEAAVRAQKKP